MPATPPDRATGGWTARDIPDQTGRTVLVTGANSGLGLHTSLALAARGARVLMACRDPERGQEAVRRVGERGSAELVPLDLASLASVRAAAEEVRRRVERLDALVNNAGVMALPTRELTVDGFERQLATNHLGHVLLTALVLPVLQAAPAPRVVVVSSEAARAGRIRFADLQGQRTYRRWRAYAQSKLANLLFLRELTRRAALASTGPPLVAAGAHPGYAATNLQSLPGLTGAALALGNRLLAQPDEHGAWPQEYAATMPDVRPGDYFGPGGPFALRGSPRRVTPVAAARDDAVAARLWEVSNALVGARFPF